MDCEFSFTLTGSHSSQTINDMHGRGLYLTEMFTFATIACRDEKPPKPQLKVTDVRAFIFIPDWEHDLGSKHCRSPSKKVFQ